MTLLKPFEEVLTYRVRHVLPAAQQNRLPQDDATLVHQIASEQGVAVLNVAAVRQWLKQFIEVGMAQAEQFDIDLANQRFAQSF